MKNTLSLLIGVLSLVATPALAAEEPQPGLVAEYFALEGPVKDFPTIPAGKKPTAKRVDKTIDVGATAEAWPGTQLTDYFYIRWTGKLRAPKSGTYTFFLESDDGSRLFIDGKPAVDNGGLHPMEEESGEVELKTGEHELKIEFFENEGDAGCKFSWQPPGADREIVPATALLAQPAASAPAGPAAGLSAEYFALDGSVEDFPTIPPDKKPTLRRVDQNLEFNATSEAWPGTDLTEHFFIRWTGKLHVPRPGTYTLYLESDDGSRLFVDGKPVVENGGLHGMEEKSGDVDLKSGAHDLKIEFFQNEGEAGCKFSWQTPQGHKRIVPASLLSH